MLLEVTFANTSSRVSRLLGSMAVTELGMILETFNGSSLQSTEPVDPMQKSFTPSVQFLGMREPMAVSAAVMPLETAL